MEHLNILLPLAIGISIVILQIWGLIRLRDRYMKKEDCVGMEHKYFMTKAEIESRCEICKKSLLEDKMSMKNDIIEIKKALMNHDRNFTFIKLLQLEIIKEMGLAISKSRIEDLERIAKNSYAF